MVVLAEYDACTRRPWTPWEDTRVRQARERGTAWPAVARELGRTHESTKHRARVLRAVEPRDARQPWSGQDDEGLLRAHGAGRLEVFLASSGRTPGAAQARLSRLGVLQRPPQPAPEPSRRPSQTWTPREDQVVLDGYRWCDLVDLATRLDRTSNAVRRRALRLGLGGPRQPAAEGVLHGPYPQPLGPTDHDRPWSERELAALACLLDQGLTYEMVADYLDRSHHAVNQKARGLGLRSSRGPGGSSGPRWSGLHLDFLTLNAHVMTLGEIAWRLGRSRHSVRQRLGKIEPQQTHGTGVRQ